MTEKESPAGFVKVVEGKAAILFPEDEGVFYNPVQEFNRDLSTCVILNFANRFMPDTSDPWGKKHARRTSHALGDPLFEGSHRKEAEEQIKAQSPAVESTPAPGERTMYNPSDASFDRETQGIRILEALAASGLRSIRYYREIPAIRSIVCNDFSQAAVENIRRNLAYNDIAESGIIPNFGDANVVMHDASTRPGARFDVVDLDPYGTASPFLDAAVKSITDGDMAVLAGAHPDACYAKYGSVSLKGPFCHESGVRILLNSISTAAARYGSYIQPLMSCSIDFYCRVFVRVFKGPAKAKLSAQHNGVVYMCPRCHSFASASFGRFGDKNKFRHGHAPSVGDHCQHCGGPFQIGGPLWLGPMHDPDFVGQCADYLKAHRDDFGTADRMEGMFAICKEELPDAPFHYNVSDLAHTAHCQSIPHDTFRSALVNAGYRVSPTHTNPQGMKTDAPSTFIWDLLREWVKTNPVKKEHYEGESPGALILKAPMTHTVDMTFNKASRPKSVDAKIVRFQENPTANWGPKARAGSKKRTDSDGKKTQPKKAKADEE
ncbi:uncharacterized protein MONBRDRAFT_34698 [Monosiga brevicollis MX1]|uniref:tRNA (guanine(26)-N(2))-dimethyltransferase n=1 Tax=Monosiga brevicollis TaxID=81824 RepID=A9VDF1_MONBE|nr:uncharacterized protein MONBRDRAFT_34698 [Monosiga brevicollis MX1]EDQ84437.1 predicted protein [Monosiga brevicollis MX1]|eukprot:XP_001750732.1 hypothetical protein [Monosiga brevicollis MX1]